MPWPVRTPSSPPRGPPSRAHGPSTELRDDDVTGSLHVLKDDRLPRCHDIAGRRGNRASARARSAAGTRAAGTADEAPRVSLARRHDRAPARLVRAQPLRKVRAGLGKTPRHHLDGRRFRSTIWCLIRGPAGNRTLAEGLREAVAGLGTRRRGSRPTSAAPPAASDRKRSRTTHASWSGSPFRTSAGGKRTIPLAPEMSCGLWRLRAERKAGDDDLFPAWIGGCTRPYRRRREHASPPLNPDEPAEIGSEGATESRPYAFSRALDDELARLKQEGRDEMMRRVREAFAPLSFGVGLEQYFAVFGAPLGSRTPTGLRLATTSWGGASPTPPTRPALSHGKG